MFLLLIFKKLAEIDGKIKDLVSDLTQIEGIYTIFL